MQIVINIDKEVYNRTLTYKDFPEIANLLLYAVANGVPLPKGHGDLIDKGKFKKWIETQDGDRLMTEYYLDALDAQEAIVRGSDEDSD